MDRNNHHKRVSVKHKHPNPLFEQWLTEWRDKAKESGSKMQFCFSLALSTLRKYPLPLETGKDCKILTGFGDKLCKMLDDKLKQYKAQGGTLSPLVLDQSDQNEKQKQTKKSPQKGNSCTENYIPQYRSGPFAILVTLYEKSTEAGYPGFLTKKQIIDSGQHLCDVSFTKSGPDSRYTGWSSMKTLLDKNLVHKEGNPAKFSLTNEGSTLGDQLYVQLKIEEFKQQEEIASKMVSQDSTSNLPSTCNTKNKNSQLILSKKTTSSTSQVSSSSSTAHETVIFAPNSFEIFLLVDTQELNGSKGDTENDPILQDLKYLKVAHEVRNLKVGDYTWICRDSAGNEVVLPYIVERKRMDDFGKSIKDDRFHEQKFRLKQCGIENLIYLIESYGKNEHVGLPLTTLYQASVNTLIHDGFSVKFTENGRDSCRYLASLTDFLNTLFKGKTLISCPKDDMPPLKLEEDLIHLMLFKDFNKISSKSRHFKVKEMFVRHLLQIKGMSVDKALAIVEKYQTPMLLKLAYNEMTDVQGEKLLSTIQYGNLRKNVGLVLSKTVYQFFCDQQYK